MYQTPDPGLEHKVAEEWMAVCTEEELVRGVATITPRAILVTSQAKWQFDYVVGGRKVLPGMMIFSYPFEELQSGFCMPCSLVRKKVYIQI